MKNVKKEKIVRRNIIGGGIILIIFLIIFFIYINSFDLFTKIENDEKKIPIVVNEKNDTDKESKNISITEGVRRSVSLNEIVSGGVGKDDIPSIDNPLFLKNKDVDYLNKNDPGIAFVDENDVAYFLPFRVLVWHEIVNMKINYQERDDFPVAVTYCPLCRTGIVFQSIVDGKDIIFGTSGKLWQSNLLMYEKEPTKESLFFGESLWSQVLGEAIVGTHTGKKLKKINSSIAEYEKWQKAYPETKVLSLETGFSRDYDRDPYGPSYYESSETYFPINFNDEVNFSKEVVLGIEIDGSYVAYKKNGLDDIDDTFGRNFLSIKKKEEGGYEVLVNNQNHPYTEAFWFSWKAAHPSAIIK